MNVTSLPAQKGFEEAVIETATAAFGVTAMVIGGLRAGLPDGHKAFEVSVQVTVSPLTGL